LEGDCLQHLAEFGAMIPEQWPRHALDAWTAGLKSICGNFNPRRAGRNLVTGNATIMDAGGLELAQVANDLDIIRRDIGDIRTDYCENLFLLLQLEGSCGTNADTECVALAVAIACRWICNAVGAWTCPVHCRQSWIQAVLRSVYFSKACSDLS